MLIKYRSPTLKALIICQTYPVMSLTYIPVMHSMTDQFSVLYSAGQDGGSSGGSGGKTYNMDTSDSDSGQGSSLANNFGSSSTSLNSTSSTTLNAGTPLGPPPPPPEDNPEQFEVLKQQKELWETGIEM